MNPLHTLISKLNRTTHTALERAASICMAQTHFNIELEHWLLALLEDEESSLSKMLLMSGCDLVVLNNDIQKSLEKLRRGNDQTPAISDRIVELIHEAWLIASLDYDGQEIDSGLLLCALIQKNTLNQLCHAISQEFDKVSPDVVRELRKRAQEQQQEDLAIDQTKNITNTSALNQFSIHLNEQARQGKIDAVIGREDEIRQVIDILSRRRQNNAILTGDPGVGKTAIVEGLARRIVEGDVPDNLKDVEIYALDMGLLQAGAGVKGEFENRLKKLISEIKTVSYPIILFIDEAHTMIGAGASAGQNDAANLLKPALARGELRCIAATTWSEYKQYFEKDAALTRRFQLVKVEEPGLEKATQMLRSLVTSLESHHSIKILDEAVCQATILSDRYISGRLLPDKSISVLDTACSRVASKQTAQPASIEKLQKRCEQLHLELEKIQQESLRGIVHEERISQLQKDIKIHRGKIKKLKNRWEKEKKLIVKILKLSDQISSQDCQDSKQQVELQEQLHICQEKLKILQADQPLVQAYVDADAIAEVIADWTGIPVGRMLNDEMQQIVMLEDALKKRIVGQDHALNVVADSVRVSRASLTDPNKPVGVFLFVGPSGVGKTETALALAEQLYHSESKMTVINMSEFKEEHKISMLSGSPPGYVGYGEGGVLTEAVRRNPHSLLLLDEMEKAHRGVQEVFYQVFDKGMLKDGQGRDINFKNTLIIMTTNACSEVMSELCQDTKKLPTVNEITHILQDELKRYFKPAFLGRVKVVPYFPLHDAQLKNIATLKLGRIQKRMMDQHRITLTFSPSVLDKILERCYQASIGARQIEHILMHTILPEISSLFLTHLADKANLHKVSVRVNKRGEFAYQVKKHVRK